MRRFQVSGDEDHLSLSQSPGLQRVVPGCMMLGFAFVCLSFLAVLAVIKGNVGAHGGEDMNFLNPRANHFGFLWLTTTIAVSVLTPIFALKVILAPVVFRFDRRTRLFTRNGKTIAPLSKVEAVRIEHADDPDNRSLHKLVVIHSDGFEVPLDNWYNEIETNFVAELIAGFCGVKVTGLREDRFEDGGIVPRSEGIGG
jgi:hypothetical protein